MSRENVEMIREMFALVNDGGVEAASDAFGPLLDPEFELEEAANVPDRETHSGRDAFIANMAKLEEGFEELRLDPIEIVDLGNKVVVVLSITGRGRAGGTPVEGRIAQLWTLRDGKALSLRDYATKADALEAVGLSE